MEATDLKFWPALLALGLIALTFFLYKYRNIFRVRNDRPYEAALIVPVVAPVAPGDTGIVAPRASGYTGSVVGSASGNTSSASTNPNIVLRYTEHPFANDEPEQDQDLCEPQRASNPIRTAEEIHARWSELRQKVGLE